MTKHANIMAKWAKDKFNIDLNHIGNVLRDDSTATFTNEQGSKSDQLAAALIVTALNEVQILGYHMPVAVHPKHGLTLLDPPVPEAFVIRARDDTNKLRWWIVHWTPAGQMVRILTSYPDKAAAVAAIRIMGYRLVATVATTALGGQSTFDTAIPSGQVTP